MNKTELTKIAKAIKLPKGWVIQKVYPKNSGKKQIADTDRILIGCPIEERMGLRGSQLSRRINGIIRQLNDLRVKRYQRRWIEFGTGFGGGKWYDISLGINY